MNTSSAALASLILVLLLWMGLSLARTAATRYFQKVEAAYAAYYNEHNHEPGQMPPPASWDFEKGKLVPIPPDEVVVDSSSALPDPEHSPISEAQQMHVHVVRRGEAHPVPFWVLGLAYGKRLARVSPLLFHGVFGGLTVVLVVIALKLKL